MSSQERALSAVPKSIILFLLISCALQITVKQFNKTTSDQYQLLKPLLSDDQYHLLSLGSNQLLTHLLTLKLQMHDIQRGKHRHYRHINYDVLTQSLIQLQTMNASSDYPAMLAARVFINTNDQQQLRMIIETIKILFEINPQLNWRWLAETVVIAKYHLKDLDLALSMAQLIAKQPKSVVMPSWSRDLEFIVLEELNQFDSAIYIVENMLKNKDELSRDEIRFLNVRLSALKQKSVEMRTQ